MFCTHQQAISKFESLVNQIQKNAKDINSRLEMIENTMLFKQPPPKIGGILPDAKVCWCPAYFINRELEETEILSNKKKKQKNSFGDKIEKCPFTLAPK